MQGFWVADMYTKQIDRGSKLDIIFLRFVCFDFLYGNKIGPTVLVLQFCFMTAMTTKDTNVFLIFFCHLLHDKPLPWQHITQRLTNILANIHLFKSNSCFLSWTFKTDVFIAHEMVTLHIFDEKKVARTAYPRSCNFIYLALNLISYHNSFLFCSW